MRISYCISDVLLFRSVWISGIKTNTRDFSHRNSVELHPASLAQPADRTIENDPILVEITRELGLTEPEDRKSVVQGKSVSVRVDLGCRRIIKNKKLRRNT